MKTRRRITNAQPVILPPGWRVVFTLASGMWCASAVALVRVEWWTKDKRTDRWSRDRTSDAEWTFAIVADGLLEVPSGLEYVLEPGEVPAIVPGRVSREAWLTLEEPTLGGPS